MCLYTYDLRVSSLHYKSVSQFFMLIEVNNFKHTHLQQLEGSGRLVFVDVVNLSSGRLFMRFH